jgi:hypothetical protein
MATKKLCTGRLRCNVAGGFSPHPFHAAWLIVTSIFGYESKTAFGIKRFTFLPIVVCFLLPYINFCTADEHNNDMLF